jgi:hypothetical protein
MSDASYPTAVLNAPADIVWALLTDSARWGGVFDMRVAGIDPPGPAVVGQKVCGETGPRIFHLKLTFRTKEPNPDRTRRNSAIRTEGFKIGEEFSFPLGAAVLCLGGYRD